MTTFTNPMKPVDTLWILSHSLFQMSISMVRLWRHVPDTRWRIEARCRLVALVVARWLTQPLWRCWTDAPPVKLAKFRDLWKTIYSWYLSVIIFSNISRGKHPLARPGGRTVECLSSLNTKSHRSVVAYAVMCQIGPIQWRHNERDSVSNHHPHDCLLNNLDADQRKHQSSASLAFVPGIHRWPVNSPHKWPVTRKMFPFDDVIMQPYIQSQGLECRGI